MASDDPLFRVENVTKIYSMGEVEVPALKGVDLEVAAGEIIVILGPSGSGKSTLLHMLGGMDRPTAGTVHFRDIDLTALSNSELTLYRRNHVGFVFQFYNLVPSLTALENIAVSTEIAPNPRDPREMAALVGLAERVDHFPSQLSGGEQQRVAIARAVAKRPEVLLCDEPTGALDAETGVLVLSVLKQVSRELGTTLMLITHNASIGEMGDRVIRFRSGKIVEQITNENPMDPSSIVW